MIMFTSDREKGDLTVGFKGCTHDIYKELLSAVVTVLDRMDLQKGSRAVPLSEAVTTFGQHLILLGIKEGKDLDELSMLKRGYSPTRVRRCSNG